MIILLLYFDFIIFDVNYLYSFISTLIYHVDFSITVGQILDALLVGHLLLQVMIMMRLLMNMVSLKIFICKMYYLFMFEHYMLS